MKDYSQVVADLVKNGKGSIHTPNATGFKFVQDGERVCIFLDASIPGYVRQDDGTYKQGMVNSILLYKSEVVNAIKASGMANIALYLCAKESRMNLLLEKLELGIIAIPVKETEVFKNPFLEKSKERVITHDSIIHLLFGVEKLPAKVMEEIRKSILAD